MVRCVGKLKFLLVGKCFQILENLERQRFVFTIGKSVGHRHTDVLQAFLSFSIFLCISFFAAFLFKHRHTSETS